MVNNASQLIDENACRLADSARTLFGRLHRTLEDARLRIDRIEPHRLIGRHNVSLMSLGARMQSAARAISAEKHLQLTASVNRLEALNPRAVLERGYSITTSLRTGRPITSADDVKPGEMIRTELAAQDSIESEVKTTHKQPKT
jgi:exodeoxyribonuclease VII large subunit